MLRYICVFTVLFSVSAAHGADNLADFWSVESVEVNAVPDIGGVNILVDNQCDVSVMATPLEGGISWEEIVNIGAKIWALIQENKPVVHVEIPVAHAMPKGMKCWSELERWNAPRTQTYEVLYKNKFGMEVVKFRFRLQFTYGGSHLGMGRYLANATVLPAQLDVSWGYKFNANLDVGQAINLGSRDNPVAGLEMNLHWNVKTWVKESENSVHFFITGNGDVNFAQ